MALYISITDEKIKFKRSDEEVGGSFWKVEGDNAACVFEVAWGAKQESEEKHGHIYRKLKGLKKGAKAIGFYRNNEYGDALIFAATGITRMVQAAGDDDWEISA